MRLRSRSPLIAALASAAAALAVAPLAFSAAPEVEARAWYVQNGATGEVLAGRDARRRLPFASITKLMTVLVTLDRASPSAVVTVHPDAARVGESTVSLRPGERVTVRDLVAAALIQSANDAAYALALHVGKGDVARFVALMNAKARRLGLADTHFVRPDGLDAPGHVSSARDVTLLARIAMRNRLVRELVRHRTAVAAGRTLHTWNDLLARFPGLVGVKTGHTAGAGWSEVAAVRRPGLTIYATILGSPARERRNRDLAQLLRFGLTRYRLVSVVDGSRVYAHADAPFGRRDLRLVAVRPALRVARVGRPLVERVVAPDAVTLPVRRGQRLGAVAVYARGKLIARRDLVAAESVSTPSLGARVRWYARETVRNLWGIVT